MCVCSAVKTCLYHSRQPKRCRQCDSGTLVRSIDKSEGFVNEHGHIEPAWFCNTCEHCEKAS